MASISIAKPGTEWGPCDPRCQHVDCLASRRDAEETTCGLCGAVIGYERHFTHDVTHGIVHRTCLVEAIESLAAEAAALAASERAAAVATAAQTEALDAQEYWGDGDEGQGGGIPAAAPADPARVAHVAAALQPLMDRADRLFTALETISALAESPHWTQDRRWRIAEIAQKALNDR